MKLVQRIAVLYLAMSVCVALFAQDSESPIQPSAEERIEEITVVGNATFSQLQVRLELAQTAVFNSYNELNQDDYYDVECSFVARDGSHINDRVCQPAFVTILEANSYQDQLDGVDTSAFLERDVRNETLVMEANMIALAEEHPEFLAETKEYMELNAEYERLKAEHCEGKIICWLNGSPD